ncbi:calcium-transporting ATPase [Chytriomyces sp. MP71]|nr:calcium-transporting ATPase [Chytriomyces sp. MP71]
MALGVYGDIGLSTEEAENRLLVYGPNVFPDEPRVPLWAVILEQFKDQLVLILLGAAGISLVLASLETDESEKGSAFVEPLVILLILIANATIGVIQESNAEKAIEALKQYSPDEARVVRNGELSKVDASRLVPGDIVHLSVGDKIPADCRVASIVSSSFKVDQAILTGEPISVSKDAGLVLTDSEAVKQDQHNMLFSGTTVTVGKAVAVIVRTGSETAIGSIHSEITSTTKEKTPLKQALDDFGDELARVISVICLLVWMINIRHFNDPTFGGSWLKGAIYYFKIAVALAVAAIPEGLAVIITTCLALGTKRMAAQGAIVRHLASVETLGCTSVICSDKTGTLTTNQMSVRRLMTGLGGDKEWSVEGSTYGPEGRVLTGGHEIQNTAVYENEDLKELLEICVLCNDAKVKYDEKTDAFVKLGEPTEAALKSLVEKFPTDNPELNARIPSIPDVLSLAKLSVEEKQSRAGLVDKYFESKHRRIATLEFSRDRKSMSVLAERFSDGHRTLYVKGAPEQVLERCVRIRIEGKAVELTPSCRSAVLAKVAQWGLRESLRVLAFATVDDPVSLSDPYKIDPASYAEHESSMTFVGLVGMLDPPRSGVLESVKKCREAGIRVIVITGDNKKTAESICRSIGVFGEDENLDGKSFTGREFDSMDTLEKIQAVKHASLFSRTEPMHKSQLVDWLKELGEIVAMTGDGVNDAPALKKADIGIAMGSGTDVAKLASDMVLADDNFATIVSAVEEGRSIYSNTKQFIRYLISSNIGEVVSIFMTVLLGMPEALIPVQLLWVNLVTDGLPATALGFNPPDHALMNQLPRSSKEPIVTSWLLIRYLIVGTFVGSATVFGYAWWFMFNSGGPQISFYQLTHFHQCSSLFPEIGCDMFSNHMSQKATTMSLSILVVVEMLNAINSLSENESLLTFFLDQNLYLILAVNLSMALHLMMLYIPFFSNIFSVTPLNWEEWMAVLWISFPVVLLDELLKAVSRSSGATRNVNKD